MECSYVASIEIAVLRKKLDELRCIDTSFETFGSSAHLYRMNAPLSETKLDEFETRHSITLPEPYRTFVSEFSNGGAGPYYGLFPLGYFDAAGGPLERWKEGDGFAGILAKPFPHSEAWNLPEARLLPPDSFENDEEEEAWIREVDGEVWRPDLVNGAFPICHQGCAIRNLLIVNGPERGNVWVDDRPNDGGIYPDGDDPHTGTPFFDWYSNWLDASIAALKR